MVNTYLTTIMYIYINLRIYIFPLDVTLHRMNGQTGFNDVNNLERYMCFIFIRSNIQELQQLIDSLCTPKKVWLPPYQGCTVVFDNKYSANFSFFSAITLRSSFRFFFLSCILVHGFSKSIEQKLSVHVQKCTRAINESV